MHRRAHSIQQVSTDLLLLQTDPLTPHTNLKHHRMITISILQHSNLPCLAGQQGWVAGVVAAGPPPWPDGDQGFAHHAGSGPGAVAAAEGHSTACTAHLHLAPTHIDAANASYKLQNCTIPWTACRNKTTHTSSLHFCCYFFAKIFLKFRAHQDHVNPSYGMEAVKRAFWRFKDLSSC